MRQSLWRGRGMISDDTEHTALVASALIETGHDPERFAKVLARGLRRWLLALPPGVGLATLRALLRSWVGFGPARSGVFSAGNGPAMRAALLGLWAEDEAELWALVRASSRLTHTDPRAAAGATLVARWAREAGAPSDRIAAIARELEGVDDLRERVLEAIAAAERGDSLEVYAQTHDARLGVTGFIVETMPAVVYCWLRHRGDPRATLEAVVRLGGDTDSVGAIVGALLGAEHGASGLPADWIEGIRDWPIGVPHLHALAGALVEDQPRPRIPWIGQLGRNLALLGIVVAHVGARIFGY